MQKNFSDWVYHLLVPTLSVLYNPTFELLCVITGQGNKSIGVAWNSSWNGSTKHREMGICCLLLWQSFRSSSVDGIMKPVFLGANNWNMLIESQETLSALDHEIKIVLVHSTQTFKLSIPKLWNKWRPWESCSLNLNPSSYSRVTLDKFLNISKFLFKQHVANNSHCLRVVATNERIHLSPAHSAEHTLSAQ